MPGQSRKIAKGKRRGKKKSNQLLEFTDKKTIPEQLILKEKPKFDMSFLSDNGGSLISRCSGFLDNVPTSSSNSAASKSSITESPVKPTSFSEIEQAWKKATTELKNGSDSDDDIEFSMSLCPMESIPEVLLPNTETVCKESTRKKIEEND